MQNANKRNHYVDILKKSLTLFPNEDRNFGIYESHRVNEILENTKLNEWNYTS